MRLSEVLLRPKVTEKVNGQMEKQNRYTFVVDKRSNKLEIKAAVEEFYNVKVAQVNTIVVPAKSKSRFTKAGFISGRKPSFKKAVVTLVEGETIDLFAF
ncbi:50S ribosomal protein L23 [Taibaiella chishuiensis]|uniref:Large ribosomal subunit protein uL23 n=1 Tax=Taibaiella chishuiensis TaxID=1434707 RepID=A0A2P8DC92_9BACT|nr:50S ribosomal protein L23 [Taibaiella chishuiensis]PSK94824.1 LSU ribosomal protein L23P [Taibaiella chishuiensis]